MSSLNRFIQIDRFWRWYWWIEGHCGAIVLPEQFIRGPDKINGRKKTLQTHRHKGHNMNETYDFPISGAKLPSPLAGTPRAIWMPIFLTIG